MQQTGSPEHSLPSWREILRDQGRSLRWLAGRTGIRERTVYAYSIGQTTPPAEWLAKASEALGVEVGHDGQEQVAS